MEGESSTREPIVEGGYAKSPAASPNKEGAPVKRGRGRPPKGSSSAKKPAIVKKQATGGTGKRGRPPGSVKKVAPAVSAHAKSISPAKSASGSPAKRSAGRPKKTTSPAKTTLPPRSPKAKGAGRGRGRPPKSAAAGASVSKSGSQSASKSKSAGSAKKGRGRPPKAGGSAAKPKPATKSADGAKRGRGRPKKAVAAQSSAVSDNEHHTEESGSEQMGDSE